MAGINVWVKLILLDFEGKLLLCSKWGQCAVRLLVFVEFEPFYFTIILNTMR